MKMIQTDQAPQAIGPYSQAVDANGTLYVSGQIPFVPETMTLVSEDIAEQTAQVLSNIKGIVTAASYQVTDIVKCTVFLKDITDFPAMNAVYADFFGDHKPARATAESPHLPKNVLLEIDAICVKSK